ncbi:MAG: four helix bundle protein [Candidatus Zixiibacteriota bacterium]
MSKDYTKLRVWELADKLAIMVYQLTKSFPKSELFGLTSQMRRAAVSVPGNIAEGSGRKYQKEFLQFLYISSSSLKELSYYIHLSKNLGYFRDEDYEKVYPLSEEVGRTLRGLITRIEEDLKIAHSYKLQAKK